MTTTALRRRWPLLLTAAAVLLLGAGIFNTDRTDAAPPANDAFGRTWARTDQPVAHGQAIRTWMWGPAAFTDGLMEPYVESPGGNRLVQYFDKSRMEITTPGADQSSP